MFLKEIRLTNFKCHESIFIDFRNKIDKENSVRKTTFLLGENGTGKSAVLKAIALITGGSNAIGDLIGESNEWIKNGTEYCEIKAIITTADNQDRPISFRIERGSHLREIIQNNRRTLELIDDAIDRADRNYFVLGYGASRRLNKGSDSFKSHKQRGSKRSTNVTSLFNSDAPLVSLESWAMELDYARGDEGLKVIKQSLNEFLLENVVFKRIDKKAGKLVFDTPDGEVSLDHLSDGYQNVASWVGDLMYNISRTFEDYKNPLSARGLLLIDEIDLHLHPKWQRQLHSFLKSKLPNFQVIATTHSPLTAQQAEECELYALRREGNKTELVPFVGDPSKMLLHQLLTSPIFGLNTDESIKIETAKEKIRAVRLKPNPTVKEMAEIKPYEDFIRSVPVNVRSNSLLGKADLALLKSIDKELKQSKTKEEKVLKSPNPVFARKIKGVAAAREGSFKVGRLEPLDSPVKRTVSKKVASASKKVTGNSKNSSTKSTAKQSAAKSKATNKKSSRSSKR